MSFTRAIAGGFASVADRGCRGEHAADGTSSELDQRRDPGAVERAELALSERAQPAEGSRIDPAVMVDNVRK
jgi:hypothetical protein